jgi:integrase
MDYPEWRQHPNHPLGKYQAGRNTALLELRILGVIMSEAIARGYANHNPCYKLGLKKDDRRLYPELTDEELERIQIQIELEPEPMRTCFRNSFLIARYHGVRLNETRLNPMTDVEISTDTNGAKLGLIRFKQKGNRHTTKPLHPNLIPFFEELQSRGVTETYPELGHGWSNKWFRLLKRAGLKGKNGTNPNACFHSLRVTVASRMARNNVSMRKAMEYLTHASTTVHAAYVRWRPEDVAECHKAVI